MNIEDRGPADESVTVIRVVSEDIKPPKNDGSRGSALYAVPFLLSHRPSSTWVQVFVETWNHPPQWSSMHRPGIARVIGDQIILDGTTVEEIEKYHKETLLLAVNEANHITAEYEQKQHQMQILEEARLQQEKKRIEDFAQRIRFDE
ncbi:MAG: hypothetical protein WCJ56_12845 [bacterium]